MITAIDLLTHPKKPLTEMQVLSRIRKGIPKKALANLSKTLSLSKDAMCSIIGLSSRTINRRQNLNPQEADKLYRVARVTALAINVLEDQQQAVEWLNSPKLALENQTPLSLLDTEIGAREVEKLLKRIEYGVYS